MFVRSSTIEAESLGEFFRSLCKNGLSVSKKIVKRVLKIPTRALDETANIDTAAPNRNPKKVLPTLTEVINFSYTGGVFYLSKFV